MTEHILSLSYGKDSLACLGAIEQLGWPLDRIIKERWGIEVEHFCSMRDREKVTYEKVFYRRHKSSRNGNAVHKIHGWPSRKGAWCNDRLKTGLLDSTKKSPLVEAGWTEEMCRKWCEDNDLLSPIYTTATRGGYWFCHNQGVNQLRLLRKNYPDLWALMLKWDSDSPVSFHADGRTVHDFDRRFQLEDDGLISPDDKIFRWDMLNAELNYRWF